MVSHTNIKPDTQAMPYLLAQEALATARSMQTRRTGSMYFPVDGKNEGIVLGPDSMDGISWYDPITGELSPVFDGISQEALDAKAEEILAAAAQDVTTQINQVNTSINAANAKIDANKTAIETQQSITTATKKQAEENAKKIDEASKEFAQYRQDTTSTITSINTSLNQAKTDITTNNQLLTTANSEIAKNRTEIAKNNQTLTTANTEIAKNRTEIANAKTQLSQHDTRITTAITTANTAKTTADGKNRIITQHNTPSTSGLKTGDLWRKTGQGLKTYWEGEPNNSISILENKATIVENTYVWDGTTWQEQALYAQNIIATGSIIGNLIAADTIDTKNLKANSITTTKIAALAINADKIAANAITADKIAANSVNSSKITANAITADKISANAVTTDKVAANSVNSSKITANAITADKIAANAITADKISANALFGKTIKGGEFLTTNQRLLINDSGLYLKDATGNIKVSMLSENGAVTISGATQYASTLNAPTIKAGVVRGAEIVVTDSADKEIGKINSAGLRFGSGLTYAKNGNDYQLTIKGAIQSGSTISGTTITGSTVQTTSESNKGVKITTGGIVGYKDGKAAFIVSADGNIAMTGSVITNGELAAPDVRGGTVTGSIIRTAESGARTEITNQGLHVVASDGKDLIRLGYGLRTGMAVRDTVNTNQLVPLADMVFGGVNIQSTVRRQIPKPAKNGAWGVWRNYKSESQTITTPTGRLLVIYCAGTDYDGGQSGWRPYFSAIQTSLNLSTTPNNSDVDSSVSQLAAVSVNVMMPPLNFRVVNTVSQIVTGLPTNTPLYMHFSARCLANTIGTLNEGYWNFRNVWVIPV